MSPSTTEHPDRDVEDYLALVADRVTWAGAPLEDDVRRGHGALRRRRMASGLGVAVAVAGVGLGAWLVAPDGSTAGPAPVDQPAPTIARDPSATDTPVAPIDDESTRSAEAAAAVLTSVTSTTWRVEFLQAEDGENAHSFQLDDGEGAVKVRVGTTASSVLVECGGSCEEYPLGDGTATRVREVPGERSWVFEQPDGDWVTVTVPDDTSRRVPEAVVERILTHGDVDGYGATGSGDRLPTAATLEEIVRDHLPDAEVLREPTDSNPAMTLVRDGVEIHVDVSLESPYGCPGAGAGAFDTCEPHRVDGHPVFVSTLLPDGPEGESLTSIELHGPTYVTRVLLDGRGRGGESFSIEGLGDLLADPRWDG